MTDLPNIEEIPDSLLFQEYYKKFQVGETTLIRVHAPYDTALEFLKERGYREATLAENAQFRIQAGKDSGLSQQGNFVKEDILYIPRKGTFLTKNPITSQVPEKVIQAHIDGKEFYPTKRQVDKALEDAIQIYDAGQYHAGNIPFDDFGKNKTTVYAFGTAKDAQNYAAFVRGEFEKDGLHKMIISIGDEELVVNKQSRPFARKVYFPCIDFCSVFAGIHDNSEITSLLGIPDDISLEEMLRRLNDSKDPDPNSLIGILRKLAEGKIPDRKSLEEELKRLGEDDYEQGLGEISRRLNKGQTQDKQIPEKELKKSKESKPPYKQSLEKMLRTLAEGETPYKQSLEEMLRTLAEDKSLEEELRRLDITD